ncbi:MAG: NUMOD3 domain-containing DNA-binding protein [Candidatus Omnitrophota bacterium]
MNISGVYKIESKIKPNRIYIGSAVNIQERWRKHINYLKRNKHHSIKLQRHYNKYGKNDLVFSILIGCDKEDLIITEQFYIDVYLPYFNTSLTAGNRKGVRCSEETKQKIRKKLKGHIPWIKGRYMSDDSKRKMSEAHKGKTLTEEHKKKIGRKGELHPMFGKHMSEESKSKMSKARMGKSPWNKGKTGLQVSWMKGIKFPKKVDKKII